MNIGNGFNNIGANNFANMFANKSVNNNKDFVQKTLEKFTNTYDIKANMNDNSVISSEMQAQIKGLQDNELSIQDNMAMLQVAENALVNISVTINEMSDLVNVIADGSITDEEDIQNIQTKLEQLTQEVVGIYDNAIYGDKNAVETVLSPSNSEFSFNSSSSSQVETKTSPESYDGNILINGEQPVFTGETLEIDQDELNALLEQLNTNTELHENDGLSNLNEITEFEKPKLTYGGAFVEHLGLNTIDVTTKEGVASAVEVLASAKDIVNEATQIVLDQQKTLENILNSNRHSVDTSDENLQEYINELMEYVKKDIFNDPSLLLLAQEENKPEKIIELTE